MYGFSRNRVVPFFFLISSSNQGHIFGYADPTSDTDTQRLAVPLIDLDPWLSLSSSLSSSFKKNNDLSLTTTTEQDAVIQQIADACRNVGFFMIQNHGLDTQILDNAWEASKSFFDLSTTEKLRHKTTNEAEYPYGYEQSEQLAKGKQLDDTSSSSTTTTDNTTPTTADLKETFAIGPNNITSGMPLRRWMDTPQVPTFRMALEAYYQHMEGLANLLLKLFALALDLSIDYFEDKMDHHMSALRLVHYYPLLDSERGAQFGIQQKGDTPIVRAGAHTDYGALTILNARSPGLQVLLRQNDKQQNETTTEWYSVPVIPDTLVINLGDLMQRWTNDKWVSTLHRVVMPATEAKERRYSMAFFVNVNGDTLIEPLVSSDSGDEKTLLYKPITAKDHLMAKHLASMEEGQDRSRGRDEL